MFETTNIQAETRHIYQQTVFFCLCEHKHAIGQRVLSVGFPKHILIKQARRDTYCLGLKMFEATNILAETRHMYQQTAFFLPV